MTQTGGDLNDMTPNLQSDNARAVTTLSHSDCEVSVTDLIQLCEDQNNMLSDDVLIERFAEQISQCEQKLYDKSVYIKELEIELRQSLEALNSKENLQ